jgi:CDP-diacylglycerol--serine O-phosphatidyltransferase
MFTLGNLVCGFFSIVVAARVDAPTAESIAKQPVSGDVSYSHPTRVLGELDPTDPTQNLMLSGWLIFLALIFDALDGHVARISRATSDFGAQLDSLCDVVTFGVAPGFLLVKMCPQPTFQYRDAIWIIGASFAACAALRLARFNVETGEEDDHLYFSGLPSPAAAAAIAGFGILFYELRRESHALADTATIDHVIQWMLPFFAMLVAALMVSRIPYPHVVNQIFRGHRSFGHVVGLVFLLVAIMSVRGYSVPIMGCGFVLYGPISYAWNRLHARREHPDPIF